MLNQIGVFNKRALKAASPKAKDVIKGQIATLEWALSVRGSL
jgi:hypothetical protein